MEVGRLGAPAGGPRPFLTTVAAFLAVLCSQGKQPKLGLNSLGRPQDQRKLIKQESLQVRKAKKCDSLERNSSFCSSADQVCTAAAPTRSKIGRRSRGKRRSHLSGPQQPQIRAVQKSINPSDHGLVLLNQSINQSIN